MSAWIMPSETAVTNGSAEVVVQQDLAAVLRAGMALYAPWPGSTVYIIEAVAAGDGVTTLTLDRAYSGNTVSSETVAIAPIFGTDAAASRAVGPLVSSFAASLGGIYRIGGDSRDLKLEKTALAALAGLTLRFGQTAWRIGMDGDIKARLQRSMDGEATWSTVATVDPDTGTISSDLVLSTPEIEALATDLVGYRDEASAAADAAAASAAETPALIAGTLPSGPVSPSGLVPLEWDSDWRVLRGIDVEGRLFDPLVDAALAPLAQQVIAAPVSPGGVVPTVFDGDWRIVSGLGVDGVPFPPAVAISYDTIEPDDPRIRVSDYFGIAERSDERLRFIRPITDGNAYQHCSPGSRAAISTNATSVEIIVRYNALVTRLDVRNFIAAVLVDGVLSTTATSVNGSAGPYKGAIALSFPSAATRVIELVWPYGDGMDLIAIKVNRGATVSAPSARPSGKGLIAGDSIPHGFAAPNILQSWPYLLAAAKSVQLVNMGYGSRTAVAADGSAIAGLTDVSWIVYLIGYNNFAAQTPISTFKTAVSGWLTNARAAYPGVKIYAVTPIYTTNTNTIPPSDYRDGIADVVTTLADPDIVLVDGLSIMTNSSDRLADGIHPNSTGSAEVEAGLAAIIT